MTGGSIEVLKRLYE